MWPRQRPAARRTTAGGRRVPGGGSRGATPRGYNRAMSLWQGYGGAQRPNQQLEWACGVYLGALFWDRLYASVAVLIPPACVIALMLWSNARGAPLAERAPLALALLLTAVPALVLSLSSLGAAHRASEQYYLACLRRCGLTSPQAFERQPPQLRSTLLLLVYYSDVWHFPGRMSLGTEIANPAYIQAWRTVNGALNAFYRTCQERGLEPVRPAEAGFVAWLWTVQLLSLACLYVLSHELRSAPLLQLPQLNGVVAAGLVFCESAILLSIRTDARLGAFLRALVTQLMAHDVLAGAGTETAAVAAPDHVRD
jgi:hypothetical protein